MTKAALVRLMYSERCSYREIEAATGFDRHAISGCLERRPPYNPGRKTTAIKTPAYDLPVRVEQAQSFQVLGCAL
jgi:hypothetical protein